MNRSLRVRRPTLFVALLDLAIAILVMFALHLRGHRPLDSTYDLGWMLVAAIILWGFTCGVPLCLAAVLSRRRFGTICRWGGTGCLLLISVLMLAQVK